MSAPTVTDDQTNEQAQQPPQTEPQSPAEDRSQDRAQEQGPPPELDTILPTVEALLVSADKPLPPNKISEPLSALHQASVTNALVENCVDRLNELYDESGRAFRIERIAGGYRVMTRPEFAPVIAAMHRARASTRLSRPALETLAIIAYRQPVTRAELEAIRGVGCGEVLRALLDRSMVKIVGRAEELGRPMLYGTTRQFLDTFGLASLKDLPKAEELADRLEQSTEQSDTQ